MCCKYDYRLSKKKMDSDIFVITREWKELESCGFHHYVDK